MNYLALHFDTDFLVGTICADEGNLSFPIKNGNDECLWLYFYNDPYSGNISFGKENQKHCNQCTTNYIGNFIELIENENNTFQLGEYEYPIIEILRLSKLLEKLKNNFSTQTYESYENIPTLLTFSLSINELAKKTIVDYLKKQGFDIISYTIPIAELACKYAIENNNIDLTNGSIVIFVEATNTNLHFANLIFTVDYFLTNGQTETKKGLGIDPRKRALLKHIVNKIGTMGILSEDEKEKEYKLMEPKTVDWLNALDMQTNDAPFEVIEALSKMPNHKKRVLVYKSKISEYTQSDIKIIVDTYKEYINNNISQDVSAIVLLGTLFQNEIIRNKFQSLIPKDKLLVYSNKDIHNILSVYPKIDFNRYISEQGRIEAKAVADKLKKEEELAKEAAKTKAEKDAKDKAVADAKKESEKQKARELYEQAIALDKGESLDAALIKIKDAISLDTERIEYNIFRDSLNTKIRERNEKTEKYSSWYKDAESYEQTGELDLALKAYKNAQQIFDSSELRKKIVKIETSIEKQATATKVNSLITLAIALANKGKFEEAIANVQKVLEVDPTNNNAKDTLNDILALNSNIEAEKQYKLIIAEADKYFKEASYDEAIEEYYKAYSLKPGDKYCDKQINKIKKIFEEKGNKEKSDNILANGDNLFLDKKWSEAKSQYQLALNVCPQNNVIQNKIDQCDEKIQEEEHIFNGLKSDAVFASKADNFEEAISLYEKALKMKPDDQEIKSRIEKIKSDLKSGKNKKIIPEQPKTSGDFLGAKNTPKSSDITNDKNFLRNKEKTENRNAANNDNFLGNKRENKIATTSNDNFLGNKSVKNSTITKEQDNFISKSPKKEIVDDNFLKKKNA